MINDQALVFARLNLDKNILWNEKLCIPVIN